jgi:hypothetical protein
MRPTTMYLAKQNKKSDVPGIMISDQYCFYLEMAGLQMKERRSKPLSLYVVFSIAWLLMTYIQVRL